MAREPAIAESDLRAERRRVATLGVTQAGADAKAPPVVHLDFERAEQARQSALAGQMPDHSRFGVLPRLEFEQRVTATRVPVRIGTMQHQALPAAGDHRLEPTDKRRIVAEPELLNRYQPRQSGLRHKRPHRNHALRKIPHRAGQLEDHVAHLPPFFFDRLMLAHDGGHLGETLAPQPKLAIEGL